MSDPLLIRAAIDAAGGISSRQFAELILGRDQRTVRAWLAAENVIPPKAREWLEHWVALPKRQRAVVMQILAP